MNKYVFGEAFCLMKYRNANSSVTELLWNSRGGVTPFNITAKDGVTELTHVDWGLDECRPNHKLMPGDRYFTDMDAIEARRIAEDRMRQVEGTEYELRGDERFEMIEALVKNFMSSPESNPIIKVQQ